ncbi:MAG TPA: hypothetical protein VGL02_32405 [Streptomyces sp.]
MATPTYPANHALLAEELRAQNLPGQRSKTAIARLRRERQHANAPLPQPLPLTERVNQWLADRYIAEINRRGGETAIASGNKASDLRTNPLKVVDRADGLTVLHVTAWRYYSRQFGSRPASLSYLCGRDDNGDWAARIPGTITTVAAALDWLTPAAVKKALAIGKRVHRQGDIYAIATVRQHDAPTGWIGDDWRTGPDGPQTSHHWDADSRILSHHPEDGRRHADLHLPHLVRFVQQSTYGHGRGAGRGAAD